MARWSCVVSSADMVFRARRWALSRNAGIGSPGLRVLDRGFCIDEAVNDVNVIAMPGHLFKEDTCGVHRVAVGPRGDDGSQAVDSGVCTACEGVRGLAG